MQRLKPLVPVRPKGRADLKAVQEAYVQGAPSQVEDQHQLVLGRPSQPCGGQGSCNRLCMHHTLAGQTHLVTAHDVLGQPGDLIWVFFCSGKGTCGGFSVYLHDDSCGNVSRRRCLFTAALRRTHWLLGNKALSRSSLRCTHTRRWSAGIWQLEVSLMQSPDCRSMQNRQTLQQTQEGGHATAAANADTLRTDLVAGWLQSQPSGLLGP